MKAKTKKGKRFNPVLISINIDSDILAAVDHEARKNKQSRQHTINERLREDFGIGHPLP